MCCTLLDKMHASHLEIDEDIFRWVCVCLCDVTGTLQTGAMTMEYSGDVFTNGPRRLRTLFLALTGANTDASSSSLTGNHPAPHIPGPVALHYYVRALGMFSDFEGLYSFTTWATANHAGVTARAEAVSNGPRMWRTTLVAVRAALEGNMRFGTSKAPDELVQLVRGQVEGVAEWGGWPSDEEVDVYLYIKSEKG
jgi:hypothetical protein